MSALQSPSTGSAAAPGWNVPQPSQDRRTPASSVVVCVSPLSPSATPGKQPSAVTPTTFVNMYSLDAAYQCLDALERRCHAYADSHQVVRRTRSGSTGSNGLDGGDAAAAATSFDNERLLPSPGDIAGGDDGEEEMCLLRQESQPFVVVPERKLKAMGLDAAQRSFPGLVTYFHSASTPPLSLRELVAAVEERSTLIQPGTYMAAVALFLRFEVTSGLRAIPSMMHRLYVACILIACKLLQDTHMGNFELAGHVGVTVSELRRLEAAALHGVRWCAVVEHSDVVAAVKVLAPFLVAGSLRTPDTIVTAAEVPPAFRNASPTGGPLFAGGQHQPPAAMPVAASFGALDELVTLHPPQVPLLRPMVLPPASLAPAGRPLRSPAVAVEPMTPLGDDDATSSVASPAASSRRPPSTSTAGRSSVAPPPGEVAVDVRTLLGSPSSAAASMVSPTAAGAGSAPPPGMPPAEWANLSGNSTNPSASMTRPPRSAVAAAAGFGGGADGSAGQTRYASSSAMLNSASSGAFRGSGWAADSTNSSHARRPSGGTAAVSSASSSVLATTGAGGLSSPHSTGVPPDQRVDIWSPLPYPASE